MTRQLDPPRFWQANPGPLWLRMLGVVSPALSAIPEMRFHLVKPHRPFLPVVCVGNATLGGAGKTPTSIAIAQRLDVLNSRPGFLTRGYGGTITRPTLVTPDHDPSLTGDEPLLLAQHGVTVVSPDRVVGANLLAGTPNTAQETSSDPLCDCIIMDDGLQNPSLEKDLRILVIDRETGFGNGQVFPLGPLRMRIAAIKPMISAIMLVGPRSSPLHPSLPTLMTWANRAGYPVLEGELRPDAEMIATLGGRRAVSFAGIARPQKFFQMLERLQVNQVASHGFADHAKLTEAQAEAILKDADTFDAMILTTEKDQVRLGSPGTEALVALKERAKTIPVTLTLSDEHRDALDGLLTTLFA